MKKTFPSFDLGIDHLFPSDPWKELKQKKEEQQRFTCLDVSELNDLVDGAQAKTTKYFATKYAVIVFQGNFLHLNTAIKFSKSHSVPQKRCTMKLDANYVLQAANAKSVQIKFYTADRLPCFGCQMFKK